MARYIDADKLCEALKSMASVQPPFKQSTILGVVSTIQNYPTADVVPKSEEGAECPTCHGTGRIGTTNWLTKNMTEKQIAEEKAKAIAEHEQYIKTEYAKEIFEEIKQKRNEFWNTGKYTMFECWCKAEDEVKKKYVEEKK